MISCVCEGGGGEFLVSCVPRRVMYVTIGNLTDYARQVAAGRQRLLPMRDCMPKHGR